MMLNKQRGEAGSCPYGEGDAGDVAGGERDGFHSAFLIVDGAYFLYIPLQHCKKPFRPKRSGSLSMHAQADWISCTIASIVHRA